MPVKKEKTMPKYQESNLSIFVFKLFFTCDSSKDSTQALANKKKVINGYDDLTISSSPNPVNPKHCLLNRLRISIDAPHAGVMLDTDAEAVATAELRRFMV